MSTHDDLVPILKKLKLSGVLQTLQLRTKEAVDDSLAQTEFLYRLLHDEVERRESKQLTMRLRRAAFDSHKSLEDFDFHFNPQVPKAKVIDLATCQFVERHANQRPPRRTNWRREVPPRTGARAARMPRWPLRALHRRARHALPTPRITCRPELRATFAALHQPRPARRRRPRTASSRA